MILRSIKRKGCSYSHVKNHDCDNKTYAFCTNCNVVGIVTKL